MYGPPASATGGSPDGTGTMCVGALSLTTSTRGKNILLDASVTVIDGTGSGVGDVTVQLEFLCPDGTIVLMTGVTGQDGVAIIAYGKVRDRGTYTATVTNCGRDGWTYDASLNIVTSGSIIV